MRESALANASVIEDSLMGGPAQVVEKINLEIENLRQGLSEEERGD